MLGSVLIVAALAEIAVRLLGLPIGARSEPTSPFGPRYLPRSPFVLAEEGNVVRGWMNNVGFHDRPFVFDLPDSVRRIGFFGDSFVEATQVEADSTFVSLFEDLANASGRRVDAAAFGVIGSGADQDLYRCLSATQQACFDEVVYVFSRNDFFDGVTEKERPPSWPFLERDSLGAYYFSGAREADGAGGAETVLSRLLQDLYLPRFLSYRFSGRFSGNRIAEEIRQGGVPVTESATILAQFQLGEGSPPEHLAAMRHWEEVVRYWKRFCDANDIVLRLLYLPWPEEVDDSLYVLTAVDSLPRWGVVSWVGGVCAAEGIPFLDPIPAFRAATDGRGKRLYGVRLNPEGHHVLAEFLLDSLPRGEPPRSESSPSEGGT